VKVGISQLVPMLQPRGSKFVHLWAVKEGPHRHYLNIGQRGDQSSKTLLSGRGSREEVEKDYLP